MYRVCLTNDDGPLSDNLLKLAEALKDKVELFVVVPDGQRSASGKALTLKRPIRLTEKHSKFGYSFVTHDGVPADSVILAQWFYKDLDLVVSGVNTGANVGYQSIFTSGTVGAALEAALRDIPAIAISQQAKPEEWFNSTGGNRCLEIVCETSTKLIMRILEKGMPEGIDLLNLNFPHDTSPDAKVMVTKPTKIRMHNEVEERFDPNKMPYYWYLGIERPPMRGSDAYEVLVNKNISLTPMVIDSVGDEEIEGLREYMSR
ncbi:5'/3'-nucleotidase SurE [Candidatus Thorarchaeota archaeon]|nr:MAG: 5'/3'-nucleotidase SurE [Candidatus Thorarchaeota archaeon]